MQKSQLFSESASLMLEKPAPACLTSLTRTVFDLLLAKEMAESSVASVLVLHVSFISFYLFVCFLFGWLDLVLVCLLVGWLVGLLLLGGIYFRNYLYRQGKTRMTDMVTRRIFPGRNYCFHKVGSMEIWGFMTSRNKIGK